VWGEPTVERDDIDRDRMPAGFDGTDPVVAVVAGIEMEPDLLRSSGDRGRGRLAVERHAAPADGPDQPLGTQVILCPSLARKHRLRARLKRARERRGCRPPSACRSAGGRGNRPHLRGTRRRRGLRRRCGRHRGHAAFADDHRRARDGRPAAARVAVTTGIPPRGARLLAGRRAAARIVARAADRRGANRGARCATRRRATRGSTTPAVPHTGLRIESRHDCGHAGDRPNQSNEDLWRHSKHPSSESRDAGGRPRAGCLLPRAGYSRRADAAVAKGGSRDHTRPTGHSAAPRQRLQGAACGTPRRGFSFPCRRSRGRLPTVQASAARTARRRRRVRSLGAVFHGSAYR
jgi:hypothetical protein